MPLLYGNGCPVQWTRLRTDVNFDGIPDAIKYPADLPNNYATYVELGGPDEKYRELGYWAPDPKTYLTTFTDNIRDRAAAKPGAHLYRIGDVVTLNDGTKGKITEFLFKIDTTNFLPLDTLVKIELSDGKSKLTKLSEVKPDPQIAKLDPLVEEVAREIKVLRGSEFKTVDDTLSLVKEFDCLSDKATALIEQAEIRITAEIIKQVKRLHLNPAETKEVEERVAIKLGLHNSFDYYAAKITM